MIRVLRDRTAKIISTELNKIGFEIFHPAGSLGYFTWRPDSNKIQYESLETVTVQDITGRLDMNGRPPMLKNIPKIQMPYSFGSMSTAAVHPLFENKFPFGQYECVGLLAAMRCRVNWISTDFCLSGSVLGMLADQNSTVPYFACRIPHTAGTILLGKNIQYQVSSGEAGYQFERLVTGCSTMFTEHLQQMKVGNFDVVFCAEVDAMSEETGLPIEITIQNRRNWGNRKMFQMISCGSTVACQGSRQRNKLLDITTRSLSSVGRFAIDDGKHRQRLESNILQGLSDIKAHMDSVDDGVVQLISFAGSTMKFNETALRVLPSHQVMKELVTNANDEQVNS